MASWSGVAGPGLTNGIRRNIGREILCCVPSHLPREAEKLHPTLGRQKGARRTPTHCGVEHPSGGPGLLKHLVVTVELAMGRRAASFWASAHFPSCVRARLRVSV